MALSAIFLAESLTRRRCLGFAVALVGLLLIALAKREGANSTYPAWVALGVIAPLSWSIYSVVSKLRMTRWSPLLWTYLTTAIGGLLMTPLLLLSRVRQDLADLDSAGLFGVLYLAVPCTVVGYAVWTWLLRHLPATTVGFTVFLNPPLTTLSKALAAIVAPTIFAFTITRQEWLGGGIALAGLALAVSRRTLALQSSAGRADHEGPIMRDRS
jgi:drug/metabolite transporter (DMT)-like permease